MILKPEDPDQFEFICRSELVMEEPLVKAVEEIVNELDLRELYGRYSESGRPFYDPRMLLKVLFFGYCDRVRSSRELSRHIRYDIRYRYYCGSLRPDFRTINRFRKENLDLLGDYFAQIVLYSQARGMIDSSLLALDGTKLRASANGRIKGGKRLRGKLERIFRKQLNEDMDADETVESEGEDGNDSSGNTGGGDLVSDPDARYMKTSEGGKRLSYNSQIVVDGNQLIVAADVSNNADDSVQFERMLSRSETNLRGDIDKVTADGGYYSGANLKYAKEKGVDLYLPVTRNGRVPDERFHRDEFVYEPESDRYRCPGGKYLAFHKTRYHHGKLNRIYSGSASTCGGCQYRGDCTKKRVREIWISEYYEYEHEMKVKLRGERGRFRYGRRKCLVEPVFGNIKFNLGFARYALRGLRKVRGEFFLICIAHNLKKLAVLWKVRPLTNASSKGLKRSISWLYMKIEMLLSVFQPNVAG